MNAGTWLFSGSVSTGWVTSRISGSAAAGGSCVAVAVGAPTGSRATRSITWPRPAVARGAAATSAPVIRAFDDHVERTRKVLQGAVQTETESDDPADPDYEPST